MIRTVPDAQVGGRPLVRTKALSVGDLGRNLEKCYAVQKPKGIVFAGVATFYIVKVFSYMHFNVTARVA